MLCAFAIFSSVACPAVQNFSSLSHKRHDFRNKKLLKVKCVSLFCLQFLCDKFLNLRRIERNMSKKIYIGLHVKYLLCLSDVNETWIFSTVFRKIPKYKFHEISSSGSRDVPCQRADGRTDMTKVIFAIRNFANALKTCWLFRDFG